MQPIKLKRYSGISKNTNLKYKPIKQKKVWTKNELKHRLSDAYHI